MLFVGTSIIHPSTEGVFLLCNILDLLIYRYMNKLDVKSCLKENFELIIDDVFTIIGVGTVATGYILTGMCRVGEDVSIYVANGDVLKTTITTVDAHTKERKSNDCGYKTEHVGLGLRGISKEQLEKGDKIIVKNANMYGM